MRAVAYISRYVVSLLAITGLSLGNSARAYPYGPPDHEAGDPPDNINCTACHSTYTVNSGPGVAQLRNLPAAFQPGQTYTLTVSIAQPGQLRWGFELCALVRDSVDAGQLAAVDTNLVQTSVYPFLLNRHFIKQKLAGSFWYQPDSASWQIRWTAPSAAYDTASFYVALNAANGDDTHLGDYIYTLDIDVPRASAGVIADPGLQPATPALLSAYPNPFNPNVILNLATLPGETARLELLDLFGRVLGNYDVAAAGSLTRFPLNLEFLPSGRYFARAWTRQGQTVITLVKAK